MKVKKRPRPSANLERLSTPELLVAHERVFGPLEAQAKSRILKRAVEADRIESTWGTLDRLAA